jgi:PKD domain
VLTGLTIPANGDTGKPLTFAAAASDVWSPVQSIDWIFGDGGPVQGAQVTHTYGGVGGNLTVSVTASDSLGNATTATRPIRIRDRTRPVLSRLRMIRRRFAVGRARTPLSAVKRGSAFRFRLSERAKVTIRIDRRVGRRYRKVKTLTRRRRPAGANRVPFSGRLKSKPLAAGRYRATLRAADRAGNRSRARRITFVIAPRTR